MHFCVLNYFSYSLRSLKQVLYFVANQYLHDLSYTIFFYTVHLHSIKSPRYLLSQPCVHNWTGSFPEMLNPLLPDSPRFFIRRGSRKQKGPEVRCTVTKKRADNPSETPLETGLGAWPRERLTGIINVAPVRRGSGLILINCPSNEPRALIISPCGIRANKYRILGALLPPRKYSSGVPRCGYRAIEPQSRNWKLRTNFRGTRDWRARN